MDKKRLSGIFLPVLAILALLLGCSGDGTKAIRVGDKISSFASTDLDGNTFSLSSHSGKPVIVRFFLINCPYCKADTPGFNSFYEKHHPKGLEIVYINNNGIDITEVATFAEELKIDFPVIYDPEAKIAGQFNVRVQPLTLVLSPGHELLAALLGGVSEAELNELLAPYFQS